jgi:hypothetical protein
VATHNEPYVSLGGYTQVSDLHRGGVPIPPGWESTFVSG